MLPGTFYPSHLSSYFTRLKRSFPGLVVMHVIQAVILAIEITYT